MAQDIELTDIFTFDIENNLIIGEPKSEQLPNADPKAPKIYTFRIPIMAKYPSGKTGPLVIATRKNLFSFGVQENKDNNGKLTGYSMPICLVGKKNDTPKEIKQREKENKWIEKIEKIFKKISDHVVSIKYRVKAPDLTVIKSPIYRKLDDTGAVVKGSSPMLYPKLLVSKPKGILDPSVDPISLWKFITPFDNAFTGGSVDPLSLKGINCITQSAIKIESVFCGAKVTHQIKLHQSVVEVLQTGPRKLLTFKPKPMEKVTISTGFNPMVGDDLPIVDDVEESIEEEVPKKVTVKKAVKKAVREK